MTNKLNEKDSFKTKTWVIPLPNFKFHHKSYKEDIDHRHFFGRDKEVRDFVEVLSNSHSTSGSYLVTGYRGAGKTSFIKKVMEIISNGSPSITSYNNPIARLLTKFKNTIIENFPKFSDRISNINISANLIILIAVCYIFFAPTGWWDFFVLPFLVLLYYFKFYGFAALNPLAWYRWIRQPVVQVPINLGHDIDKPKNVIFSLITLLRDKYIETIEGKFKPNKIILTFLLIIFSFIFTFLSLRFFPIFHKYMETKTHMVVFNTTDFSQNYCTGSISHELNLPHIKSQDKWTIDVDGNQKYVLKQGSATTSGYPSAIREYLLVPIYCGIHTFSQDFYNFDHKNQDKYDSFIFSSLHRLQNIFIDFESYLLDFKNLLTNKNHNKLEAASPYQIILLLLNSLRIRFSPTKKIIRRLDELHKRIQASDMIEKTGFFENKISFFQRRKYQYFQTLDERQAENLLLQVLEENSNNFLIQPRIIFLFDELDKIDPPEENVRTGKVSPVEVGLSESIRQRQQQIEKLLANLKNLITTASCNSIFAAGREMLDANLADRGEIRFLHGTLFDRVFYISSFLTDSSDDNGDDISSMIEQYVCRRLMSPVCARASYAKLMKGKSRNDFNDYNQWSLKVYMEYLKYLKVEDYYRFRLLSFLQYFIYFLSYRSGGNTKKLDLQFEAFLQPLSEEYFSKRDKDKYHQIPQFALKKNKFVLHFDFQEQYRVQLIAHFFTIFHGSYSKLIRQYGDKLSLSVFSVLDYVCKFHSMSFSRTELERMPGALDIHRAPALPQVVDMLLDKILSPYIQNIDNGLYNFHFSRYIQREIVYISQFNEEEMAAFNFSLDESIQIKQHYRQILNEQTKLYKEEHSKSKEIQGNYVFSNLHTILGDLHAQDNEFDQALTEYLHAVSHLNRNLFSKSLNDDTSPVIFYIQVLLKIGLLQERRMLYDAAIVSYSRAIETINNFTSSKNVFSRKRLFFEKNVEQLKILFQPYLCLSFLHAKRDHSLDAANDFMQKYVDLIKKVFTSESTTQKLLIYQHNIRWAEVFMMRSEFEKAIGKYINAIKNICNVKHCDISESLAGLADACTALALKQWYENKELPINFLPEEYDNNYDPQSIDEFKCAYNISDENLKTYFEKNVKLIIKLNDCDNKRQSLIEKALHLYVLASHAYRLSASPEKESLMLWKLAYVVGYGLNYIDGNLKQKEDIDWLFRNLNTQNHNKNPIRNGFAQIFGGSYSVHRNRLKDEIGVNDEKVLRWITPPLTQVLLVLGHFWHSYWGDGIDDEGKPAKMDETAFEIVDMGAFPMKVNILALYLKARWYQTKTKDTAKAFVLFINALENGQAYEGGLDSISVSLGMIYFHIWEIVKDNDLSEIKRHKDFKGDMQRYFSLSHCRNRTKKYLTELLSRHHIDGINPERFFSYMNKQYYLYNDFSHSYVNGVWAIEYGLVPVAQQMLKQINEENL